MNKIQIDQKSLASKKGKNKIFLPPIQNLNFPKIDSGSLTRRNSNSNSFVIVEGKVLRKSETLRERLGENLGKRGEKAGSPELIRFEKLSVKLGKIVEEARVKYDFEERRVRDDLRFRVYSPVTFKDQLNKYTIRSKLFKQTQDWVPVL